MLSDSCRKSAWRPTDSGLRPSTPPGPPFCLLTSFAVDFLAVPDAVEDDSLLDDVVAHPIGPGLEAPLTDALPSSFLILGGGPKGFVSRKRAGMC
jgi:hypothetical protein